MGRVNPWFFEERQLTLDASLSVDNGVSDIFWQLVW
jgi:hypothetical protein